MSFDLDFYKVNYFQNSDVVPYELKEGGTLLIYPISVKDYPLYEYVLPIIKIEKNEMGNVEFIKMSYLDFLQFLIEQDENNGVKLVTLLNLCLKEQNIGFIKKNNRSYIAICESDDDNTIKYLINKKEFDDICKIILNQNDYNFDNRYISPDVRQLMDTYNRSKYGTQHTPTLEERKAFVALKMGKTFNEINQMTYREFDLIYTEGVNSEIYIGEKIIQGSFKFDVKEDVQHPLYRKKVDPYSHLFEETSVLSNKGIVGAEKLNNLKTE